MFRNNSIMIGIFILYVRVLKVREVYLEFFYKRLISRVYSIDLDFCFFFFRDSVRLLDYFLFFFNIRKSGVCFCVCVWVYVCVCGVVDIIMEWKLEN